ncbi:hypothetical protein OAI90_00765 [Crocinitomicaceae bacterium]|nr:hypothetical protein [Crocinitomicaceae bacterium]
MVEFSEPELALPLGSSKQCFNGSIPAITTEIGKGVQKWTPFLRLVEFNEPELALPLGSSKQCFKGDQDQLLGVRHKFVLI